MLGLLGTSICTNCTVHLLSSVIIFVLQTYWHDIWHGRWRCGGTQAESIQTVMKILCVNSRMLRYFTNAQSLNVLIW